MGHGHHLCSDGQGLGVFDRGAGLVQPQGAGLAPVDLHGRGFLYRGGARGHCPLGLPRDLQYRSRQPGRIQPVVATPG